MKSMKTIILLFLLAVAAAVLLWRAGARLTVGSYTVASGDVSEALRVVCVSDLHGCEFGENNEALLARIDALEPDLIVLPGDLFPDRGSYKVTLDFMRAIAAKYPCYYVLGNHEIKYGDKLEILSLVRQTGVVALDNSQASLRVRGQTLHIFGLRDPQESFAGFEKALARLGATANPHELNLLLSHRPQFLDEYAAYPFDLVVSGHAHGGQWRIPYLLPEGLFAPDQGFFPRITGGLYESGGTTLIVSRGLSKQHWVPRIFNATELVAITIVPE